VKSLHRPEWSTNRIEQCGVCMPQPAPVRSREPQPLTSRLQLAIEEIAAAQRRPLLAPKTNASASSGDGLLRLGARRPSCPADRSFAAPCLRIVEPTFIDGLPNPNTADFEINITPT
jgi:hypothetical protein